MTVLVTVAHRLGNKDRIFGKNQVAPETRFDVVDMFGAEPAYVEAVHQWRRQGLDDSNQHARTRTLNAR